VLNGRASAFPMLFPYLCVFSIYSQCIRKYSHVFQCIPNVSHVFLVFFVYSCILMYCLCILVYSQAHIFLRTQFEVVSNPSLAPDVGSTSACWPPTITSMSMEVLTSCKKSTSRKDRNWDVQPSKRREKWFWTIRLCVCLSCCRFSRELSQA